MELKTDDYLIKLNDLNRIFTICPYLKNNEMIFKILNNFLIRHRKCDVSKQINIPGYEESVIWVKQTKIEHDLYISKINNSSRQILQQLCCHPLIAESIGRIIGNKEVNLDEMKKELINFHKNTINKYTLKLSKLDENNQAYYMLKTSYTTKLNESKFMLKILTKIDQKIKEENNCSICFDQLTDPILTQCGHLFCNECIHMCLKVKPICPMCRKNIKGTSIININKKKKKINNFIIL